MSFKKALVKKKSKSYTFKFIPSCSIFIIINVIVFLVMIYFTAKYCMFIEMLLNVDITLKPVQPTEWLLLVEFSPIDSFAFSV